jgi:hypothetical protein
VKVHPAFNNLENSDAPAKFTTKFSNKIMIRVDSQFLTDSLLISFAENGLIDLLNF